MAGLEAEGLQKLGALRCHHLAPSLQDPLPREARFPRVQEVVDTPDLYLCRLPPERLWREQGSKTAVVVQASAWVSAPEPRAAVADFGGPGGGVVKNPYGRNSSTRPDSTYCGLR